MVRVQVPRWPVGQQADYELRQYAEKLTTALARLATDSDDYALYSGRLTEVQSEQATRRQRRQTLPAGVLDDD